MTGNDPKFLRVLVQGAPVERVMNKLRRKGVAIYQVQKRERCEMECSLPKKSERVAKRICEETGATLTVLSRFEPSRELTKRIPFLIGAAAFLAITCLANRFVFRVEITGANGLENKIYSVLAENGLKENAYYLGGKEKEVAAKIIALDGVSYCSIEKLGTLLKVEVQTSPFQTPRFEDGEMTAQSDGVIRALTVLSGTPLKKAGDPVKRGEPIVGAYFLVGEGEEQTRTQVGVIARVVIARTYRAEVEATDEKTAFAKAKFEAFGTAVGGLQTLEEKRIEKTEKGYLVEMVYTVAESKNF